MLVKEKHPQVRPEQINELSMDSADESGASLEAERQAAQRFLSAADTATAGALSTNSQAFLHASRQQSGQ